MNYKLPDEFNWVDVSNLEYKNTLDRILFTNDNLNIIGNAGSGKSTLLKLSTQMLMNMGYNVVLLSSTGIAAVNISSPSSPAVTLHSFFKIKPLDINPIEEISTRGDFYPVINKVDVFIIDEASMISAQLFEYMVELVRAYKDYNEARMPRFILFSDILQLAPVVSSDKIVKEYYQQSYNGNIFFFNSVAFNDLGFKTIILKHIFRQKDGGFQAILNRVREGIQTNEDLAVLNDLVIPEELFYKDHELFMNIETTNKEVNQVNEAYFHTFRTTEKVYRADISGTFDVGKSTPLQEIVRIKEDMQVMCLKNNYEQGYQNGSIGKVLQVNPSTLNVKLETGKVVTVVREKWEQFAYRNIDKKVEPFTVGTFTQIGAKPAACVSVWKSQGNTFDSIYFNPGYFTPEATIYVALSRLRTLQGLGLKRKLKHSDIKVHREALDFLNKES